MSKQLEGEGGESKAKVAPPQSGSQGCDDDRAARLTDSADAGTSSGSPDAAPEPLLPRGDDGAQGAGECATPAPTPPPPASAPLARNPKWLMSTPPPRDVPAKRQPWEPTVVAPAPGEKTHFAKEAALAARGKALRSVKKLAVPKEVENFRNTLGPEMFEPWLLIVRGRLAGLAVGEIAKHMRLDEELVGGIVGSPLFMGFEATFRRTMNAAPQLEAAAARLAEVLPETVENLIWWSAQRNPQTGAVALAAIKTILSANGVTTEKKSVERSRTMMPPDQQQRLLLVFEKGKR